MSDTDAYPILTQRGSQVGIKVKAGTLGRTVSSLWRRNKKALNKRLFKSVIMLSGTLTDAVPDMRDPRPDWYRHFRYEIGATKASGEDREVMWYGNPIPAADVGYAVRIVYPERSPNLLPVVQVNDDYSTNPAHSDFIAAMIHHIFHHERSPDGSNRILALFVSGQALNAVADRLQHYGLHDHVIAQRTGMRFVGRPLTAFRVDPQSILLSTNWQGINATTEDGQSLVDHLVVTKVPLMPSDERRAREFTRMGALRLMFNEAHWQFRQGMGRAGRDMTARYTLWIGDTRIPLPDEMVPPYAKYTRGTSDILHQLYEAFEAVSLQRFGRSASRTGILAGTVTLALVRNTANGIVVTNHEVMIAPRIADRVVMS